MEFMFFIIFIDAPIITLDAINITVQEGDNTSRPCYAIDPPFVTVELQNTTGNATNVVFTCNADSFPTNYTSHGWTQCMGNTLVRTYTEFTGMLSNSNKN